MRIAQYLPRLTVAEFNRFHMLPLDACQLAAVDFFREDDREVRKFLNNISDRGYLPFMKAGGSKTSPKLYSLKSCIIIRAMHDLTARNRRPYEYVAPIANKIAELAEGHTANLESLSDLDSPQGFTRFCVYGSWGDDPKPEIITLEEFTPERVVRHPDNGIYAADELIWNTIRHYADYWARDRQARGLDAPLGRYDGSDENGDPLDISHPWYADLTPLERAKRLVEIEEYLGREEAAQKEGRQKKQP